MASELIDELIRRGRIDGREAQRVSQHQLEHGGSYDTALLELGMADEPTILSAMSSGLGQSVANPSSVRSPAEPGALRAFPEQWAKKYSLAPLAFDRDRNEVSVLTSAPADRPLLQRLSAMLEMVIVPLLTTEMRVQERLHHLYGAPIPERFQALLRGRSRGDTTADLPPMPPPPDERAVAEFQARVARLREARGRDEIVHLLLAQARTDFDFCAFFVVTDHQATGWSALGSGSENIARVVISEPKSAFSTAIRTQAHVLGPLPLEDQRVLAQLERLTPRAALIIPIRVRERPVALLYAENGAQAISPRAASELMLYASHAGQALEELLLRRKTAVPRAESAIVKTSLPPRPSLNPVAMAPTMPAPESLVSATWDAEVAAALEAQAARAMPWSGEGEGSKAKRPAEPRAESHAAAAARDLVNAFVERSREAPAPRSSAPIPPQPPPALELRAVPKPEAAPAPLAAAPLPRAESEPDLSMLSEFPDIEVEEPPSAALSPSAPAPPRTEDVVQVIPVSLLLPSTPPRAAAPAEASGPVIGGVNPPAGAIASLNASSPASPPPEASQEPRRKGPTTDDLLATPPVLLPTELRDLAPGPIPDAEWALDAPPSSGTGRRFSAAEIEDSARPTEPPAASLVEAAPPPVVVDPALPDLPELGPLPPLDPASSSDTLRLSLGDVLEAERAQVQAAEAADPIALPGARRAEPAEESELPRLIPDEAQARAALSGQIALQDVSGQEEDDPFSDKSIAPSDEDTDRIRLGLSAPSPQQEATTGDDLPVPPLASDLPRPAATSSISQRPSSIRRSAPPAPSSDRPRWESHVDAAFSEWSGRASPAVVVDPTPPLPIPEPAVPELRRETWVRASSRASRASSGVGEPRMRVAEDEDRAANLAPVVELGTPRHSGQAATRQSTGDLPAASAAAQAASDLARVAADPARSVAELTRAAADLSVATHNLRASADLIRTSPDSGSLAERPAIELGVTRSSAAEATAAVHSAGARAAGDGAVPVSGGMNPSAGATASSAAEIPAARAAVSPSVVSVSEAAQTTTRREEPPSETTAVVDRSRTVGPEQLSALIDQLESPDLDRRGAARAALLHHHDAALPLLMARFPGRVSVDPFAAGARIPAFGACGELLQTLAAMGAAAQVPIAERLDDSLPIVRFFALHYFASFTVPEAIPRILRRLHDEEQEIAAAAVNVLGRYRDLPAFRQVLAHLHARFASRTPNARRHAARLLSLFRDPSAVPLFIDVFERKEKTFYDAAEEALAAITKQRFGPNARKWSAWWEVHARSPRTEWLIEGLDAGDADLRRGAAQELRSLSGFDSGFDENAPRRARDEAKRKWVSWWVLQNGSGTRAR